MSVFESLLNNDFTVSRPSRAPNGQGGFVVTYVAVGAVRGRMRPASSAERTVAAQEQRQISHVLYVKASETILRSDRVTGDELTVEVKAVREPSRADEHLEIECLAMQKGGEA